MDHCEQKKLYEHVQTFYLKNMAVWDTADMFDQMDWYQDLVRVAKCHYMPADLDENTLYGQAMTLIASQNVAEGPAINVPRQLRKAHFHLVYMEELIRQVLRC